MILMNLPQWFLEREDSSELCRHMSEKSLRQLSEKSDSAYILIKRSENELKPIFKDKINGNEGAIIGFDTKNDKYLEL